MNNMGREIMAALKRFQVGSDGDGVTVGGALVVSGATSANTFTGTVVNATTIDTTNIEVTNIKAKDGTASASIADSTGKITVAGQMTIDGIEVGQGAGNVSTNTAVGASALAANEAGGTNNTAIGYQALDANTTGDANTAVGDSALGANTTASNNTAVGYQALFTNTTGAGLTAVGYQSFYAHNGSGTQENTGLGAQSGYSTTSGYDNTFIGYTTGYSNTTGYVNTAIGARALYTNTTGNNNISMGYQSLYFNTTGSSNTALGNQALEANTTASNNTAVGYKALTANTTGVENNAFGYDALKANTTGSYNTAIGYNALGSCVTGQTNTAIGVQAGAATTSSGNTFIGNNAGNTITTGAKNTIIGRYDGNQGGLDIRTASNHIVLSDGDGNIAAYKTANGDFFIGGATTRYPGDSNTADGFMVESNFRTVFISRSSARPLLVNRNVDDGALVDFHQAGTLEGSISVSGSTVSYNGGHLSRWAQMLTKPDLLKGTVMSNLDEMNVYVDADGNPVENEQLNKVKVSDVEGDANVAGVFVNWDYDKAHQVDEINMAMTGDMIIRIAQGVTVARGDLLMSAGDGTAKPQGDDIVRSKTIAKVTSTHVTCTYDDGSYCVPCVLMAC
jgi:hypothetical protein